MERAPHPASVEFLEFLADISDPATGEIRAKRLASRLGLTESELYQVWSARENHVSWAIFVDEVLSVLDVVQDVTQDLESTVHWFQREPIPAFNMKTAQRVVATGGARTLVALIKRQEIEISAKG